MKLFLRAARGAAVILTFQCFFVFSMVRRNRKDSGSGFNNVGAIGNAVQQRFAEPRGPA